MVPIMALRHFRLGRVQHRIRRTSRCQLHQRVGLYQRRPFGRWALLDMEVSCGPLSIVVKRFTNFCQAAVPIPVYTPSALWNATGDYDLHYWGTF